ncbi:MAG: NAD-dependent epimerase/dehydratase family protein [Candidatus Staskawiczbacteria bacterium]|jgi:UDP-glucose 4-epimerase
MNLKNKKILVTGGTGFIGSHTVDALIKEGADVVVVDNLSTGHKENLNPRAKFYEINIADPKIEEILETEKPEIIYHFSFFVLVPKSVDDPLLDIDNIIGSIRILKKIKQIGGIKKIVFPSSGFTYGNTKNLPAKETEPQVPASPYAIAKINIENYLKFYKESFNIPYVILRYSAIYGPRQVTGALSDYMRQLASGKQAEMWGDGNKTRDYVYISDVVRANLLALDVSDSHPDPVFNVGSGIETTLNSLYQKTAELLNKKPEPIYHPDRPGEQIRYCLDNSKIKKELGWSSKISLEEGLKSTLISKNLL